MSVKLHRQAEQLMADAELHAADGRNDEAQACWLEAAHSEAQAFDQIPEDWGQTRGIIAVSVVALYRRAGALDEAVCLADRYLDAGNLPPAWQAELGALRDTAREELRVLATNGTADSAHHPQRA